MKRTLAKLLAGFLVVQSLGMTQVPVMAGGQNKTAVIPENLKLLSVKDNMRKASETKASEITGELAIKLNFVYPEKPESLEWKQIKIQVLSGGNEFYTFPITKANLNQSGKFQKGSKTYHYQIQALNDSGVPVTTEKLISYLDVVLFDVPQGEYSVRLSGKGYTTYESEKAKIDRYSQQIVIATDDGRFQIGDADGNGKIEEKDRKLVEQNLTANGSAYEKQYDFNQDGVIDIVDLAMVNRHIDVPKGSTEVYQTSMLAAANTDLTEMKEKFSSSNITVNGDIESLFKDNGSTVKIEQSDKISAEKPLEFPIVFKETAKVSQLAIDTPSQLQIEAGTIEIYEDGKKEPIQITVKNGQPEGTEAITLKEGTNSLVINLGKKVAVKKVVVKVEKVTDSKGETNYVAIDEIKFLQDIVPANPGSQNGVVKNIEVKNGSNEVTLTWSRVANITGYKIYMSDKPGKELKDYTEVDTVSTQKAVIKSYNGRKMKNYSSYYFVITSINDTWQSAPSEEIVGQPVPNKPPLKPDNVKIKEEDRSLSVSWQKTDDAKTYHVYYRKSGDSKFVRANKEPIKATSYAIGGLNNGTVYEVYVTASNPLGESPKSLIHEGKPYAAVVKDPGIPTKNKIKRSEIASIVLAEKGNYDANSYPNGFSPDNMIDGNFATHWSAQAWWRDATVIVNFKEAHEMNFLTFVPRLDGEYINSPDNYTITVWKEGDDLSKAGTVVVKGKSVKMIKSKEENNNGKYAILSFPKTKVKKIALKVNIFTGATKPSSISELAFYDYYSLVDEVCDLFSDNTFTKLKTGVTSADIAKVRSTLNAEDSYYVDGDILKGELDLAQSLLDGNKEKLGKVMQGISSVKGLNPLGISAKSGYKFVIYAQIPDGEKVKILPTQYFAEASAWQGKEILLNNGRNVIEMPDIQTIKSMKGGPVYYQYTGAKGDEITLHIEAYYDDMKLKERPVRFVPVLELLDFNQMSDAQRKERIASYISELETYTKTTNTSSENVHNTTEISMPHVLLSLPAAAILNGIKEANPTLEGQTERLIQNTLAWNQLMYLVYTTHGVKESDMETVRRENVRYMRMFGSAFMFAAGSYVGIGYGSAKALVMGEPTEVTGKGNSNHLFGWGIAHEIGHNNDTLGIAETTNNIYSLFAQTEDGGECTLKSRVPFESVFEKTAKGVPGASNNVFVQLGMYWQLHLAYDGVYQKQEDNFYFRVNQELANGTYKVNDGYRTGKETYTITDRFALIASKLVKKDLSEYFTRWGLNPSEKMKEEMASQGPAETRAIYYFDDSSRAYRLNQKPDLSASFAQSLSAAAVVQADVDSTSGQAIRITWEYDEKETDSLQGFEIYRNEKPIGFVMADSKTNEYIDPVGAANNLTYRYAVAAVSKLGTITEKKSTQEVKISYDAVISRDAFTLNKKADGTIEAVMKQPQSICGIRIKDLSSIPAEHIPFKIYGTTQKEQSILMKETSLLQNDSTTEGQYLAYFNKPGSDANDTRIWTYDVNQLVIEGLPEEIDENQIDFVQYPGDNVTIDESAIGYLENDYVYDASAGDEGKIAAGTLIIMGSYRGDPAYNLLHLMGQYEETDQTDADESSQKIVEREMDGYALLFAELPEDKAVSEISDGVWIFVPDVQKEKELQEISGCQTSILPFAIKAQLYRTDTMNSAASKRLASDTPWVLTPTEATLPQITIKSEALDK